MSRISVPVHSLTTVPGGPLQSRVTPAGRVGVGFGFGGVDGGCALVGEGVGEGDSDFVAWCRLCFFGRGVAAVAEGGEGNGEGAGALDLD